MNTCAGLVHHRQAIEYVLVPPSPRVADLPIELACFQINVSGMATNILKHKKDSESFIYILEIQKFRWHFQRKSKERKHSDPKRNKRRKAAD